MIRIHLDESTLARTRIAISPLTETIGALQLLHRSGGRSAPWPYTAWAVRAREVLRAMPETTPLRVYGQLYGTHHGRRTPDLFEPIPLSPAPDLVDELAVLRRTPQDVVDEQFAKHYPEGIPDFLVPYREDRARALGALADALAAFWEQALAPYWPAMRTALDEEVLTRSRSLAAHGPETLLAGLSGPLEWKPPVLSLSKPKESRMAAVDQRLLLVPSVFADEKPGCSTDHPTILRLTYQARGAAVLAGSSARGGRPGPDRLGSLIGRRRAAVLRALDPPATTTGVAALLGLPPSTVSEQLTALQAAGVVHRHRSGRRVFYGLEPAGVVLLSLFTSGGEASGAGGTAGDVGAAGGGGAAGGTPPHMPARTA